jgi:hypothetical protein
MRVRTIINDENRLKPIFQGVTGTWNDEQSNRSRSFSHEVGASRRDRHCKVLV